MKCIDYFIVSNIQTNSISDILNVYIYLFFQEASAMQ